MRPLLWVISAFIVLSSFLFVEASASTDFLSDVETQITPASSSAKIVKLQNLFTSLGLYNGEINGQYSSIEWNLVSYQISAWIIENADSWGAGYFWKKTLEALETEFWDTFINALNLIEKETPKLGERDFVITAYYSPLPGQSRYTTGSYAWDIRLNGGWKITASGKGVFPGLLAAPRNYDYGTKIYFKGIWVWVVEDRWWAIVNAWERGYSADRIDIWMGYGDDGLNRALKWWKRTVQWKILDESATVSITFDESPVEKYSHLRAGPESNIDEITQLQTLLTEVEVYSGDIDGKYESVARSLVEYQIKNNIISSSDHDHAWYFGSRTIGHLRKQYGGWLFAASWDVLSYDIAISQSDKQKISQVRDILDTHIKKQSQNNTIKKEKLYSDLQKKLQKIIDKQKNIKNKNRIKYLKVILKQ